MKCNGITFNNDMADGRVKNENSIRICIQFDYSRHDILETNHSARRFVIGKCSSMISSWRWQTLRGRFSFPSWLCMHGSISIGFDLNFVFCFGKSADVTTIWRCFKKKKIQLPQQNSNSCTLYINLIRWMTDCSPFWLIGHLCVKLVSILTN